MSAVVGGLARRWPSHLSRLSAVDGKTVKFVHDEVTEVFPDSPSLTPGNSEIQRTA
jgi:hypothetical protein